MGSTYSIFANKKILFKKDATIKVGSTNVPASLFGDLEEKFLKSISFGFTENFEAGIKQATEDFAKLTKPVSVFLKALISKFPLIGGALDNVEGLRETSIFLYTLISQYVTSDENPIAKAAEEIMANFERVYMYNVPVRKQMPAIDIGLNGFTVSFAFGKCNIFDAKQEVYLPIQTLKKALFPSITALEGYDGLGEVSNSVKVPYSHQVILTELKEMAKGLTTITTKEGFFPTTALKKIKESSAGLESITTGSDTKEIKRATSGVPMELYYYKQEKGWFDGVKGIFGGGPGAWLKSAQKLWASFKQASSKIREAGGLTENFDPWGDPNDDGKLGDFTTNEEVVNSLIDYTATNADSLAQNGKKLKWEKSDGDVFFKVYAEEADSEKQNALLELLKDCINIEPIVVGKTLKAMYDSIKGDGNETAGDTIETGYPLDSYFSLEDMYNDMKNGNCKSHVFYNEVLYTRVKCDFDYSQLDSSGYPMAGTVTVEKLWNLRDPQSSITIK